jgi:DNA-binding NtrC family response regulator
MNTQKVLIVDDEKNIRNTLLQALEPLDLASDAAVNGEEALGKLKEGEYGIVLLDLKMPGMDGMEVLRRIRQRHGDVRVVMITAHGTIDSAVEAMKLGAVDFIQKPFAPKEIRAVVEGIRARERLEPDAVTSYEDQIALAKRFITDRHFAEATAQIKQAVGEEPGKPEAFNLLGVLLELEGNRIEAQKNYRAALALDPTYRPADDNLRRSVGITPEDPIRLGGEEEASS